MKISVLIIAHNEEKYIAECINSVLHQTQKSDEIILIAHNCTDKTIKIAGKFPITVIPYKGKSGIVYARLKGMDSVSGDIILCIDGDSFAKNNWIKIMVKKLKDNDNILVGSYIKFKETILGDISNIFNKHLCVSKNKRATPWIWGSSFAFWKKDLELIKYYLKRSIILSNKMHLSRNPDDNWLSLFISRHGNIEVTNKTFVTQHTKETSSEEMIFRILENHRNGNTIRNYFKKTKRL
jgi:glycosyltransferase involved in cell wall biosynthesis